MRPRPFLLAVGVVLVLSSSCGGQTSTPSRGATSSGPDASMTMSVTDSMASEATASPSEPAGPTAPPETGTVRLPRDAPRTFTFGVNVDVADLPMEPLAPPGALIGTRWGGTVLAPSGNATRQVAAFTWSRGDAVEPETGLEVWEHSDATAAAPWRVVFAFTDRTGSGVLGVRLEADDVTRDRSPDLLSFEDLGGSGACGVWRVIAMNVGSYEEIYRAQTCDTSIRIVGGDLVRREAVYAPNDAHCCPSAFRTTTLRWTRTGWDVVDRSTQPA